MRNIDLIYKLQSTNRSKPISPPESAVPLADRTTTSLIHKMPVKASKGSVLSAFVLEEKRALLHPELLQVGIVMRFLRGAARS